MLNVVLIHSLACAQTLEVNESNEIYVIEKILDSRAGQGIGERAVEYHVAWRGYPNQDTWEPYANIKGRGDDAITQFLQSLPAGEQPGRPRRTRR